MNYSCFLLIVKKLSFFILRCILGKISTFLAIEAAPHHLDWLQSFGVGPVTTSVYIHETALLFKWLFVLEKVSEFLLILGIPVMTSCRKIFVLLFCGEGGIGELVHSLFYLRTNWT